MNNKRVRFLVMNCIFFSVLIFCLGLRAIVVYELKSLSLALVLMLTIIIICLFIGITVKRCRNKR